MNDLDLEDIESHLYSQVYHSNEQTEQDQNSLTLQNIEEPTHNMGNPNRYFQKNRKNTYNNQTKGVMNYLRKLNPTVQNNAVHAEYLYTKDSGIPFRPLDVPFTQAFGVRRKIRNRERRKKKKAIAKFHKGQQHTTFQKKQNPTQHDIITLSDSDGESCVEIAPKWPTLSITDSDDEANKKIAANKHIKTLTETPVDASDDVIFVEPSNSSLEIINIDEEVDKTPQKSPDESGAHIDVETASVASSSNSFINAYSLTKSPSAKNSHKERKELLSTPDSASNDFINNTGEEVGQKDFNFGLHGKDFNDDQFVKPTNPSEACETESSSSTTDNNVSNTMKTIVFNEIEFPKEGIFSEANLETFGNFITPLRKNTAKRVTQSSTPVENMSPSRSQNVYSSDSSSESDFEDADADNVKESVKKSKPLPELSPMLENKALRAVKKTKLNISSKYDILNTNSPEITKPLKQKKRKSSQLNETNLEGSASKKKNKNKKRKADAKCNKSLITEAEDNSTAINSSVNESTADESQLNTSEINQDNGADGETRQKRKKSREISEEPVENTDASHSKKTKKSKKKKSLTETEPTDDNIIEGDSSVQQQKDSTDNPEKDQNVDNVEPAASVIPTEAQYSEELLPSVCNIKLEKDDQRSEKELPSSKVPSNVQVSAVKIEQDKTVEAKDQTSENTKHDEVDHVSKNTEVDVKLELSDDLIIVDQVGENDDIQVILSSDSESNLSPLTEQQDIQLVNCEDSFSQGTRTVVLDYSENPDAVNLTRCTVAEVQHNMSNDPKMWTILDSDRMPPDKSSILNRRCNRCREKGHMAVRCPNKVLPKCRLCGEGGHYEPRCPNRICTQCGTRRPYSTTSCGICMKYRNHRCELCLMLGHPATACPDLWRRYHLTTTEGPIRYSNGPLLKPKNKLWCSGCARSGHLEHTCRFFRSMYPPSDPRIKSYEDVYNGSTEVPQVGQSLDYGINNNYNTNIQFQPNAPRYPVYHNQSNYSMNSYVDNRLYLNNQGNFLETGAEHAASSGYYHDKNNYQSHDWQSNEQFFFEDNLPNFISFDTPLTFNYENVQNAVNDPSKSRYYNSNVNVQNNAIVYQIEKPNVNESQPKLRRSYEGMFNSAPAESVRQFITRELQILLKISREVNSVVRSLRKYKMSRHSKDIEMYNKRLNMVLFGVYKLHEGGKHLVKLKNFKVQPLKAKLNQKQRRDLYKSYCYIFSKEKHSGVDYNRLLSRI